MSHLSKEKDMTFQANLYGNVYILRLTSFGSGFTALTVPFKSIYLNYPLGFLDALKDRNHRAA